MVIRMSDITGLARPLLWCAVLTVSSIGAAAPTDRSAIGTIGATPVYQSDIEAQDRDGFDRQRKDHDLRARQLQFSYEQARYELLQQDLDKLLDRRAEELEAHDRGTTVAALEAAVSVAPVSDAEVRALYEANSGRTDQTLEQLAPDIKSFLATQHNDEALRRFRDQLRARHHIESRLEPYRVNVSANGPLLGRPDAPITIIEFADFQCPYCRQEEATLHSVMAKYTDQVRLVFRQLPLSQIHPNAVGAALSAACADQQGRFWPMHDALFADQNALGTDGLKDAARRVGLDMDRYAACLASESTRQSIEADIRSADDIGIASTPFFFVNGRPLAGSVPPWRFDAIIQDELRRAPRQLTVR
jgi:protein-disulfide isomerase